MNEEDIKHRLKNAVVLLAEGNRFNVGDLTLETPDKSHLTVVGWTTNWHLENISKQLALTELEETKELFKKMINVSQELSDFIKDRQIEYCLSLDFGTSSMGICRETNGQLVWDTQRIKE